MNLNSTSNIIYHFETHHPKDVVSLKGSQVSDVTSTTTTKLSSSLNKSNTERSSAFIPKTGPIDLFTNNIPTTKAESRGQVHKVIYMNVSMTWVSQHQQLNDLFFATYWTVFRGMHTIFLQPTLMYPTNSLLSCM